MTELAIRTATLPDKIDYARFLAKSNLLPPAYRQHPENVLYAVEYGELLGLHPMAAITGINIIDGKPSISAGLISALVRNAGHRIRVQDNGSDKARCQINRKDDPQFTYSATWDMDRAKLAGLLGKTNWQKYPLAMLKARAISECARDACQEVLVGIAYTPDELGSDDDGGELVHDGWPTTRGGMVDASQLSEDEKDHAGLMTREHRVEHAAVRHADDDRGVPVAERIQPEEPDPDDPWLQPEPKGRPPQLLSGMQYKHITELLDTLPLGEPEAVQDLLEQIAPPRTEDLKQLTRGQARLILSVLRSHLETAGGDVEAAASEAWKQYHAAKEAAVPGDLEGMRGRL